VNTWLQSQVSPQSNSPTVIIHPTMWTARLGPQYLLYQRRVILVGFGAITRSRGNFVRPEMRVSFADARNPIYFRP